MNRSFFERWLTVDARSLGLFRIYFGLLLLANLYDRVGGDNLISFYSNEGMFPNHYALFRPPAPGFWSLMIGFSSPSEVRLAVGFIALVYFLYTIGWQTRWMQVLALLCYESLNFRFLLIQHGGNVVTAMVMVWTAFLPLGARYSVDSLLRSLRLKQDESVEALGARAWLVHLPKSHLGLAFFCICFNFAAIYFFNAIHKNGVSWVSGDAVHYVLWQNRIATTWAELLRMHEPFWFSPMATWGTLAIEWALPVLILSPWYQRPLRTAAFVCIWVLHGGIALLSTLGPFSFAMMGFGVLMLQGADFDWARRRLTRPRFKRTVYLDFGDPLQRLGACVLARMDLLGHLSFEQGKGFPGGVYTSKPATGVGAWADVAQALPLGPLYGWLFNVIFLGDLLRACARLLGRWYLENQPHPAVVEEGPLRRRLRLAVQTALPAVVLAAVLTQMSIENWSVPEALKVKNPPTVLTDVVAYAQLRQGWGMFAPEAPLEDMLLVVDATLADGSHLDLLTGKPPDFDAPLHGPFFMDQHWCEVHQRMPTWPQHWRNFKDYLYRLPALRGWGPEKQVVALEVWEVRGKAPPPGSTTFTDLSRRKLFDQNI